jgi:cobalt/nickel transport system ATP-binding protein
MADSSELSRMVIQMVDLSCRYHDGTEALRGINLDIREGEAFALIGPNGAGKSTLLLCLAGLLHFTGKLKIRGQEWIPQSARALRKGIGLVFQDPDDQLFMPTIEEDVAFGPTNLGLSGEEMQASVREALEQVHLWDKRLKAPHHMSYGEKRRAALATALAMRPQILLLDEPTSNLDPATRREFIQYLESLDITRVIATHDLDLAAALSDRCAVLAAGRVAAVGPTKEVLSNAQLLRNNRLA